MVESAGDGRERDVHQTNGNVKHIIIESKIHKSLPESRDMSTCCVGSIGSSEKWFT